MKYWLLLLWCCSGVALAADPAEVVLLDVDEEQKAVFGRWASEGSIIEIGATDGQLHAVVIALLEPVYQEGEEGEVGAVKVDMRNPDEAQRVRPIIGIDLLEGYSFKDGKWQGRIYDPESGNTYKSQMNVDDSGNLRMRGYIGVPMLGRTAIFNPISSCVGNIPKMVAVATLDVTCPAS